VLGIIATVAVLGTLSIGTWRRMRRH
jgi:hypothetical protein